MVMPLSQLYKFVDDSMKHLTPPNTLYGFAEKNVVKGSKEALFDTPHGYWESPGHVPVNHSQAFPTAITKIISEATRLVEGP